MDTNLRSHGTGIADLSYVQWRVLTADQKRPYTEYEGRDRYVGDFQIARKLHMYDDLDLWTYAYGDTAGYDWLPCLCQSGWNDLTLHDARYHSAAPNKYLHGPGFFDCTACPTPYCLPGRI